MINQGATQADPTNTSPVTFDVVFSEGVTGFAAGDVAISGTATTGLVTVTPVSASAYTVTVVVSGDGTVVAAVNVGAAVDAAGNSSSASTSTDNTVTYDATAPTDTNSPRVNSRDPTNTNPVSFVVVFSEDVTGFAAGDVAISVLATRGLLTSTLFPYTTLFRSVVVSGDGTVVAAVNVGAAVDAAGNSSSASTSTDNSVTYDATAP